MLNIVQLLLQEWNHLLHGKYQCKVIYMLCYGILWSIWIIRNKIAFNAANHNWDKVYDLTFHHVAHGFKLDFRILLIQARCLDCVMR
jgi:hypothetical protein